MREEINTLQNLIKEIERDFEKSLYIVDLEKTFPPSKVFLEYMRLLTNSKRKKTLRTELVNLYLKELKKEALREDEIKPLLLVDIMIGATDDLIDNINDKLQTYKNAVLILFSTAYFGENLFNYTKKANKILTALKNYLITVSQIPIVENYWSKKIEKTSNTEKIKEILIKSYEFRAKDIDFFADTCQIFEKCNSKDRENLRTLRALQLVLKDLYDLDWDIKNKTKIPLVATYLKLKNPQAFNKIVKEIKTTFLENLYRNGIQPSNLEKIIKIQEENIKILPKYQ